MNKAYLTYTANASGYYIYYKHTCIGGYQIQGKPRVGKGGEIDKKVFTLEVEAEIAAIRNGWGLPLFLERIEEIDQRFRSAVEMVRERKRLDKEG